MVGQAVSDVVGLLIDRLGGENVVTAESELIRHGSDESYHPPAAPDVVAYPRSTDDVAAIVRICRDQGMPIVPFGAGTSLEGHVAALLGGVCVDMSRMNRVLDVRVGDFDVTVEAGVTRLGLAERLRLEGVFFPIDTGADATIGGMASTGASGTTTVRYGTMRENVLGLTVVLPSGEIVRTRSRARKSSAGYDLTSLFVGAEGTLGIITEVVLRVYPVPDAISAAVCSFPSIEAAVGCAITTIQSAIPVARIELLDELQMEAVLRRHTLPCSVAPTLFVEFHGSPAAVAEQASEMGEVAAEFGCSDFAWADNEDERLRLWEARHQAYPSALALRPGCSGFVTDVCVPISRLAECVVETQADIRANGLQAPIVGHVGDGNFHVLLLIDRDDPAELARAREFNDRLVRRAIAMEGTCTGEHGVGYGKQPYLELEHGAAALDLMRTLKHAIDPEDLMNPGKVVAHRAAGRAPHE